MRKLGKFSIVIDSNEYHHGHTWVFGEHTISVQSLLKYGCDYSVRGQTGIIGVERKSYMDLVGCLGNDWKRFVKQLKKLQKNRLYCVIVEGNIDDPIHIKSRMIHDAVILKVAKVTAMGIPIVFASTRAKATMLCIRFFEAAIQEIQDG